MLLLIIVLVLLLVAAAATTDTRDGVRVGGSEFSGPCSSLCSSSICSKVSGGLTAAPGRQTSGARWRCHARPSDQRYLEVHLVSEQKQAGIDEE